MKTAKVSLIVVFLPLAGLLPQVSGASPKLTTRQIASSIQHEVNAKYAGDKEPGEQTKCTYVQKDAVVGYVFTCSTFNEAGTKLAITKVTLTVPQGNYVTWNYATSPAEVTFVITGSPRGAEASISLYGPSGTEEKSNIHLPYSITVAGGKYNSVAGSINSMSSRASITCEIKATGQATVRNTSSGAEATVACV